MNSHTFEYSSSTLEFTKNRTYFFKMEAKRGGTLIVFEEELKYFDIHFYSVFLMNNEHNGLRKNSVTYSCDDLAGPYAEPKKQTEHAPAWIQSGDF